MTLTLKLVSFQQGFAELNVFFPPAHCASAEWPTCGFYGQQKRDVSHE